MGPNARLQGVHAGRGLHLDIEPPLVSHVEVTERQRSDHQTDRHVPGHERHEIRRKQAHGAQIPCPFRRSDLKRAHRDEGDQRRHHGKHGSRSTRDAHASQSRPGPTQHPRARESDPQQEEGGPTEIGPEAGIVLPGKREHQGSELNDQDNCERGARLADVRQMKGFVFASGGVCLHASLDEV